MVFRLFFNFLEAGGKFMFAEVAVPLPIYRCFTYRVPCGMEVVHGQSVVVPFGKTKTLTGVVVGMSEQVDDESRVKDIIQPLELVFSERQVELWKFVADYYCAPLGEVYKCAVPSLLISKDGEPDRYKPKIMIEYSLNPKYERVEELEVLKKELNRAKKQLAELERFVVERDADVLSADVRRNLVKRGVIERTERLVSRIDLESKPTSETHELTEKQAIALQMTKVQLETKPVVLLHGVTSSGKTEIYLQLIKDAVERGKQVLFLVPEIALTQHLYDRIKQYFGNSLGVFHAQCTQEERVETYKQQLSENPFQVMLGTKASVFLPFRNLGLVIVDEEHDLNYKQSDQIPYYNAKNVALYLARMYGAKTVVGSATPSVESFYNFKAGKYGYTALNERFGGVRLPQIQVVDIREERRRKHAKGHFSRLLIQQMTIALSQKHQVILFQNRRGFATYVQCDKCGYIPKCPHCDVALNYSRVDNSLSCRYCGYKRPFVVTCDSCKSVTVSPKGFGVERLEDEVQRLFPEARIKRAEAGNVGEVLNDFEAQKIDILIGTRAIIKGIDYSNVTVLGVMDVDILLNHPDFRATEEAYQLLMQAAGRTGRRLADGFLILQTSQPENEFLAQIKRTGAIDFYNQQMEERQLFMYPPYCRLIKVVLKHTDSQYCDAAGQYLVDGLKEFQNIDVNGPIEPQVGRVGNVYVREIYVKLLQDAAIQSVKCRLMGLVNALRTSKGYNIGNYAIDVDPI